MTGGVPILLIGGFLGAGKTTLINRLLAEPNGRRLAAVVNDFGAAGIDAELIGAAADGVVSLENGCICCSLQGDLLRTLSTILRRDPAPDAIVIETSGVSDPGEIVKSLLDPVVFKAASLDAVVCLADGRHLADRPELADDALFLSQIRSADFVGLTKIDAMAPDEIAQARAMLERIKPSRVIFDDGVPLELLFGASLHRATETATVGSRLAASRFDSMVWRSNAAVSLERFQRAVGGLAPRFLRAKGFVALGDRQVLFQLVGGRATVSAAPAGIAAGSRLVLIGEIGGFQPEAVRAMLDGCRK